MRRTIFGEILVTCLLIGVTYAIVAPFFNQFKWKLRYGSELDQLRNLFAATSMYAGANDDRFPSSISEYDRYLLGVGRTPSDPMVAPYWSYPGTCSVLNEYTGKELCSSMLDILPDAAQPIDKNYISWKAMTGSSYDTSSRFGIYHVALSSTWNCPTMPMFWSHPYKSDSNEPVRVTYFEGETKWLPTEEFAAQISCLKDHIISE